MTQYEFFENLLHLTNSNDEERVIDLSSWEMFDPKTEDGKENIKYLFEAEGMGERNPFATDEELENYNKI